VTALRWARILRGLRHRVDVVEEFDGRTCDVMVALHARKSAPSVERLATARPEVPIVVALTGTDLYGDLGKSGAARRSVETAHRLVVLQPEALRSLSESWRAKARVIIQSARRPPGDRRPRRDAFEVCVLAHLRPVKDPFRTAMAARLVPEASRLRVLHLGAALDPDLEARARSEEASNPRYRWLGETPRWRALRVLARCRLLVLTSRSEGGANVVSEAIAAGVPVLSTRIPGSVGLLGADYPGLFGIGDTQGLADLVRRAESEPAFLDGLGRWCRRVAPMVEPARERRAWRDLIRECVRPRAVTAAAATSVQ
jgi:putative glycosyltransferase (TIGR04348 family)